MDYNIHELIDLSSWVFFTDLDIYSGPNSQTYSLASLYNGNYINNGFIDIETVLSEEFDYSLSGYLYTDFYFDKMPTKYISMAIGDEQEIYSVIFSFEDDFGHSSLITLETDDYSLINQYILEQNYNVDLDTYYLTQIGITWTSLSSDVNDMYIRSDFSFDLLGYNTGYNDGRSVGYTSGFNVGYNEGETSGYNTGFNVGYNEGYNEGSNGNTVLGSAITTVADTPLSIFKSIFDVDILGFNVASTCLGLCGIMLVIWLVRKFMGGD